MAAPKFKTPTDKEEVLATVAKLNRRGYSQYAIADQVGVNQSTVSYYLKEIRQRYTQSIVNERKELVAEKLEQVREVITEAWEAWVRSKKDREKVTEEETSSNGYIKTKTGASREGQFGEVAYLNTVLRCIQAERELLGLDAPKTVTATVQTLDWNQLVKGLPVGQHPDEIEQTISRIVNEPQPLLLENQEEEETDNG